MTRYALVAALLPLAAIVAVVAVTVGWGIAVVTGPFLLAYEWADNIQREWRKR